MKRFYHAVNLRSRAEMTLFLQNHFRYDTMNSWNQSTSYACNLKIHRLGLSAEIVDRLFEMMETQEFFDAMRELRDDFNAAHKSSGGRRDFSHAVSPLLSAYLAAQPRIMDSILCTTSGNTKHIERGLSKN